MTFRYKRALLEEERRVLLRHLLRPQGRKLEFTIIAAGSEHCEMIFSVGVDARGEVYELSDIVERAKTKTGKLIIKNTGERWSPFYNESYDHIIRDESEYEVYWQQVFDLGALDDTDDFLWVAESD